MALAAQQHLETAGTPGSSSSSSSSNSLRESISYLLLGMAGTSCPHLLTNRRSPAVFAGAHMPLWGATERCTAMQGAKAPMLLQPSVVPAHLCCSPAVPSSVHTPAGSHRKQQSYARY
jgi:hypothetical protein